MSIPKEPRQLMINLMYLVLTALLALNVSAEIINAFFALEKGIRGSSAIVDDQNKKLYESTVIEAGKNPKHAQWGPKAEQAKKISEEFSIYMDGVKKKIWDAAGGPHPDYPDKPKDYKNKDITTRILVTEGVGAEIQKKVEDTKKALLAIVDPEDLKTFPSIPLTIDSIAKDSKAKSWPEYKFKQMPVAAVMPILAKLSNDAKTSANTVLNYCFEKTSGRLEVKMDKYLVAIAPKKAYLISGKDRFEAELALGAYSSTASNIKISANGASLPVREGKAIYQGGVESGTGEKTFNASASVTNPATGEVTTVKGEFKYEVGQTSVAVSADKMNVFYMGVDNPISVAAAGVSSNSLRVSASGAGATISGSGKSYTVRVASQGECNVTVSSPDMASPATFKFRAKRIPDPIPTVGGKKASAMGNGEFKANEGVIAILENFDFDAKCQIVGFNLVRMGKREDPINKPNAGGRFSPEVQRLVDLAKPGDGYLFTEIKAKCPGDAASRDLGSLGIQIR